MTLRSRRLLPRGPGRPCPALPRPDDPPSHPPLPLLVHSHARGSLPPGPLEEGMVEVADGDRVLHGLTGFLRPDGTVADLPAAHVAWARRLCYRHLKREGCLAEFGVPVIPAYEYEALEDHCRGSPRDE